MWVSKRGSFSFRTAETAETEATGERKSRSGQKSKSYISGRYEGMREVLEELHQRDRKHTLAGTDNTSQVSQCLKMRVSDLDSSPPRR